MSRICYAPTKIDEKLGALLGVSKNLAAAVRGYYDTKMEELGQPKLDLTDDDEGNLKKLLEAKNTINEFRKQQRQVQHAAINRAVDKMADSFRELKANFSAEERFNRVNMIATDFSFELDKLKAKFKDSSRTELCNGCKTVNGTLVGGEDTLFALVYEKYLQRYNDAMSGAHPNIALAEKWEKVLDNWNALIPYARVVIRQTEAIKLGNSSEFAIEADESNFSDNLLAELFNPEESTREGYQDIDELRSAYASIGKEVRRAIAETYLYLGEKQRNLDLQKINEAARQMKMNGRSDEDIAKFKRGAEARAGYAMDDLGYLVRMNPVSTHQQLLEICKGSLTTDRMFKRMKASESEGNSWLTPLISKLEADAELQTKFRNDLHKNFQLYSTISKTIDNGVVKFRSTIKNFKRNNLRDRFYTSITYGKQVQRVPGDLNSIYDETGNFNWENLKAFTQFISEWLYTNADRNPSQYEVKSEDTVFTKLKKEEEGSKGVKLDTLKTKRDRNNIIRQALRALGMDVSDAEVDAIMNSASSRNEVIKNLREVVQYGFKSSTVGNADIRRYITGKQETFNPSRQKYMDAVGQRTGSDATELRKKLDKILEVIASKNEAYKLESRVPYKDKKGKTNSLSSFINPCYLGDFIEKINEFAKEKDVDGLKKFLEDKFMCSSYYGEWVDDKFHFYNKWLEELYNCDKKNIDKAFASLLSYKRFLGTASQNFEDFTSKQHTLDLLTEFSFAENKRLGNRPMAWYPVFITGDSGVQRYLQAPVYKKEEILEGLFNVWKQEEQKWQLMRGVNKKLRDQYGFDDEHLVSNISHKVGTETKDGDYEGGVYSFLPFLNKDFKGFDGKIGTYAATVEKYKATDLEYGVRKAIKDYMEDAEANFKKQLTNLGIIKSRVAEDVDPNIKDKLVTQRFEYTMSFFNETNKRHPKTKEEQAQNANKTREQKFEETEKQFLEDFFYNTKFATIQQLQLMTVDPAYYGKEKKKDGVWTFSDETKDLQKRYKEIHAPGTTLDIYARDKYRGGTYSGIDENGNPLPERCIYFDEIKINAWNTNPEFMQVLEKKYGKITKDSKFEKYLENAYTDGQGYRSLESYRKVMGMAGKWDEEMERAYKAIQDLRTKIRNADRDATREELEQMSEIMTVVFQPIKPYMYTFEQFRVNNGPGGIMNIPVQHKYAEAVLIPELLPAGSQLRYLAEYMDNPDNNIDLVCSTTVVKVGSFGSTDISQATTREAMNEALSRGYVHQLSYSDYRIQTNVPDHFNNQSQLFGTQIRKLIMAGINLDPNSPEYNHYRDYVDFGEEHSKLVNLGDGMVELNGHNLIKFYNELITSNIVKCYDVFAGAVKDIKGLSNLLTQSIINNERESLDNILAFSLTGDSNFLVPLFEGATEHDSAALILSKFKKRVNKQTIQGGSAVQVSAWGINRVDKTSKIAKELQYVCSEDGENVLYAQCEVPFDLTVYDSNNQPIKLQFTDYCNPDGTLIMDGDVSKLEKEYPGILDMIAYRIPTEKAYSMLNLKIVRFSQKIAGGTLRVPAQGTTQAGFDFDIDKLYFMRKCFKHKSMKLSQKEVEDVWKYAYEHNLQFKEALEREREKYRKEKARGETTADELIDKLLKNIFSLSDEELGNITQSEEKNRLYKFWQEAGLPGTAQEFFDKYRDEALGIKERFVTYDPTKTPWENEKIARDNMLIDLMRARLMDEETLDARVTPQSFYTHSQAARFMRELQFGDLKAITQNDRVDISAIETRMKDRSLDPEPNYDPSDPMTIVTYNQQNQVASKLIGIFANQNANYALSTLMHTLSLNLDKCKIGFCGHQYNDLLHKDDKEFARMVEDNVAGYLAASVDAVKDPVLNFLNLNTLNADAGAALARLGYTPREIGLLFNQPSVRAICDNCFNNNTGQISEEIDTYMKACIDLLHNKYGEDYVKDASTDGFLTQQVLSDMIVQDRVAKENNEDLLKTGSRDFIYNQIKVMEQFKNAMALSKAITDFVRVTRFTAANSIGSTLGNIYAQQLAVEDYVRQLSQAQEKDAILNIQLTDIEGLKAPITMTDNSFLTGAEYMKSIYNNPFAYEQCMFDMNRRVIRDLCSKEVNEETGKERRAYYPYETVPYKSARMLISQLCNYGTLDEETVNQIHSDLLVYLMNKRLGGSIFDGNAEYRELGEVYEYKDKEGKIQRRYPTMAEYYREIFPQQVFGIRDHLSNVGIPLFEAMSYKTVQLVNGKEVVVLSIEDSSNMQSFQSDAVRDSWEDLFNGKYDEFVVGSVEEQTKMAVDLFLYNFYKSGFSYTPFSFIHLAPAELKASLQIGSERDPSTGEMRKVLYKDFLNELLDSKVFGNADTWSVTMQEFAKLFIKNHIDNSKLAYTIRTGTNLYRTFSSNIKVFTQSGAVLPSFTVDLNSFKDVKQFLTIPSQCTKELTAFKPCLVIDNQVYIANGNSGMFNISTDETMEYVWVADIGELNPDDVRNRTLNYTPGVAEDYASRKVEDGSNQPPSAPTNPFGTGNTSVEPQPVTLDGDKVDRDLDFARGELINQMIKEITLARMAAGDTEASIKAVREEFMSMDNGSFEAQLEAYKNAQRDNSNLLVLDKDGKVKPAC